MQILNIVPCYLTVIFERFLPYNILILYHSPLYQQSLYRLTLQSIATTISCNTKQDYINTARQ